MNGIGLKKPLRLVRRVPTPISKGNEKNGIYDLGDTQASQVYNGIESESWHPQGSECNRWPGTDLQESDHSRFSRLFWRTPKTLKMFGLNRPTCVAFKILIRM